MTKYRFLRSINGVGNRSSFDAQLKKELLTVESGPDAVPQQRAYDDGVGIPSIGIGFNIRTFYAIIAKHMGIDPSQIQDQHIRAVEAGYIAHVAFKAPSRGAVEAFHAAALAAGGTDNGAPGLRPHYGPNYYAAFVLDPDGLNIEAVHGRHE